MGEQPAGTIEEWIARAVERPRTSGWITVDQGMISGFADLTHDWNFLHVDGEAARRAGLGGTIAHGFLTLSLLSPMRMSAGLQPCPGMRAAMNYGFDKARFLAPVQAGDRVRGHFTTTEIVATQPGRYRETVQVSVEIEGREKPALIATWLAIYLT